MSLKKPRLTPPPKTGWPAHLFLLQDDCSELSRWFASKPEARYLVKKWAAEKSMKVNKHWVW